MDPEDASIDASERADDEQIAMPKSMQFMTSGYLRQEYRFSKDDPVGM